MPNNIPLNVLFFKEGNIWIAQCITYDIATQGESLEEARSNLEGMLLCNLELDSEKGIEPFSQYGEAPLEYQEAFKQSKPLDRINLVPPYVLENRLYDGPPIELVSEA